MDEQYHHERPCRLYCPGTRSRQPRLRLHSGHGAQPPRGQRCEGPCVDSGGDVYGAVVRRKMLEKHIQNQHLTGSATYWLGAQNANIANDAMAHCRYCPLVTARRGFGWPVSYL